MELFQLIPGFSRIFQGYIEISGFSRALGTMQASLQAHVTRVYLSITTYLVPQIINFNIKNLGELKLSLARNIFSGKNNKNHSVKNDDFFLRDAEKFLIN